MTRTRTPSKRPILTPESPNAKEYAEQIQLKRIQKLLEERYGDVISTAYAVALPTDELLGRIAYIPKERREPDALRTETGELVVEMLRVLERFDVETTPILERKDQEANAQLEAARRILRRLKSTLAPAITALAEVKGAMETPCPAKEVALRVDAVLGNEIRVFSNALEVGAREVAAIPAPAAIGR
jgi:hypothetical protein